jgi:PIN domain nuclease of toxin-antitoxin system
MALHGYFTLTASLKHYDAVASLPLHHKDPFDRLIVAQAMVEQIPVISIDDKFDHYQIQRIW